MILKRFNVERVETDPLIIKQLLNAGFKSLDLPEEPPAPDIDYTKFRKVELVEMAEHRGMKVQKSYTKAKLIEMLETD